MSGDTVAQSFQSFNDVAKFITSTLLKDWTKVLTIVHDSSSDVFVLFYEAP